MPKFLTFDMETRAQPPPPDAEEEDWGTRRLALRDRPARRNLLAEFLATLVPGAYSPFLLEGDFDFL
jgi:hypothetical protein